MVTQKYAQNTAQLSTELYQHTANSVQSCGLQQESRWASTLQRLLQHGPPWLLQLLI
jgi:hypothetical protein